MKFKNKPNLPIEVDVTLGWWRKRHKDFPQEVYLLFEKFLSQEEVSLTDLGFSGSFLVVSQEVEASGSAASRAFFHLKKVAEVEK